MRITNITATNLQDDIIGPLTIEEKKQVSERMKSEQYLNILAVYTSSIFQDFENFLRTEIDLVEDVVRLALDKYDSNFITYELTPGIYNFKDLSEALFTFLQLEDPASSSENVIEIDDFTMKTQLVVKSGFKAITFDEKLFFSTVLGFTSGWNYKHYKKYISQKFINLSTTNKIHLKCVMFLMAVFSMEYESQYFLVLF